MMVLEIETLALAVISDHFCSEKPAEWRSRLPYALAAQWLPQQFDPINSDQSRGTRV
jgi:hypothetical protein